VELGEEFMKFLPNRFLPAPITFLHSNNGRFHNSHFQLEVFHHLGVGIKLVARPDNGVWRQVRHWTPLKSKFLDFRLGFSENIFFTM